MGGAKGSAEKVDCNGCKQGRQVLLAFGHFVAAAIKRKCDLPCLFAAVLLPVGRGAQGVAFGCFNVNPGIWAKPAISFELFEYIGP